MFGPGSGECIQGSTVKTRVVTPHGDLGKDRGMLDAVDLIRRGGIVAFPTETVYGLGGDATNRTAVEKIFEAKRRPADNPAIVHVSSLDEAARVGVLENDNIRMLLGRFWPGPLTVVIPAREPVRSVLCHGLDTVAVRMPAHPIALALIRLSEVPIAAPSANLSGRPSATNAGHVREDFDGVIPLILDGGPCEIGIESTVLEVVADEVRILRPGAVSRADIESALGHAVSIAEVSDSARSPGTRYPHYRPSVPVVVVARAISEAALGILFLHLRRSDPLRRPIGYIGPVESSHVASIPELVVRVVNTANELANSLYGHLRDLDGNGVGVIVVREVFSEAAVMDRVNRAASFMIRSDSELVEQAVLSSLLSLMRDGA